MPTDVEVIQEEGRQESARALVTELEMLGFEVWSHEAGGSDSASGARSSGGLVVVLPSAGGAKMRRASGDSWTEIPQSPGEPPDHLALRTAELARALLLDDDRGGSPSPSQSFSRRISTTLSQRLLLNGYGSAAGGIGQDVTFWFGRLGVGPVGAFSMTRQHWNANPKKFSLRIASVGLVGRYSFAKTNDGLFEAQLMASVSATSLLLREEGGKDEDRFRGTAWGMQGGGGVDLSVRVTPHVRLGGQTLTEMVTLFSWPEDDDRQLGGKEAELLVAASELGKPRLQVVLAFAATGEW